MLQCLQIFNLFIRHKCINYINIIKGKENARNSVTTPFMEALNNTKSVVNMCAQKQWMHAKCNERKGWFVVGLSQGFGGSLIHSFITLH